MKTCTLCKQSKPTTEFTKHAQKSDGLSPWCKVCKRIKDKEAAAKRKEAKAVYDKQYAEQNKTRIQQRSKQYRDSKKSAKAAYDKAYRATKGELLLQKKREYYYTTGKDVQYKWMKNNPEKVKAYYSLTSAKRRTIVGLSNISSKEVAKWITQQVPICVYCGADCKTYYEIDHIDPLSKGGIHHPSNFAIACRTCNASKNSKSLIHWLTTRTNRS